MLSLARAHLALPWVLLFCLCSLHCGDRSGTTSEFHTLVKRASKELGDTRLTMAPISNLSGRPIESGAPSEPNKPRVTRSNNICITTYYDAGIKEYGDVARLNHEAYAVSHGYRYAHFTDPQPIAGCDIPHPYWQKLNAVGNMLNLTDAATDTLACDWVMWIDADAIFTNFATPIESIIHTYAESFAPLAEPISVILTGDVYGGNNYVNTGLFLVRNNLQGRLWLEQLIGLCPVYRYTPFPEQSAAEDLSFGKLPATLMSQHPQLIPEELQPYISYSHYPQLQALHEHWQSCMYVLHVGAKNLARKRATLKKYQETGVSCTQGNIFSRNFSIRLGID